MLLVVAIALLVAGVALALRALPGRAERAPDPPRPTEHVVRADRTTDLPRRRPPVARPPEVPTPYRVEDGEVHREAKQAAVEVVEALTTYERDTFLPDLAARVAGDDGQRRAELERAARPLHRPHRWSRGAVVYPQLGGMRPDRASVMVVVRQELGRGSEPEVSVTRTLDVRLSHHGGSWTYDELASAGGAPVDRPADLSPEAAAVLDHPNIEFPDSARWDIHRGGTSPTLLRIMADLADQAPIGVVVLESGHPHHVFATDRVSAHIVGRAVDVYRFGETRVIDDRRRGSVTHGMARWLYGRADLGQLGSPWDLEPGNGRSFTDVVHQDHLHIAVP